MDFLLDFEEGGVVGVDFAGLLEVVSGFAVVACAVVPASGFGFEDGVFGEDDGELFEVDGGFGCSAEVLEGEGVFGAGFVFGLLFDGELCECFDGVGGSFEGSEDACLSDGVGAPDLGFFEVIGEVHGFAEVSECGVVVLFSEGDGGSSAVATVCGGVESDGVGEGLIGEVIESVAESSGAEEELCFGVIVEFIGDGLEVFEGLGVAVDLDGDGSGEETELCLFGGEFEGFLGGVPGALALVAGESGAGEE